MKATERKKIMQTNNEIVSDLLDNYCEKLFYFCLKKTSNSFDAEDLTSDIIENILTELKKGTVPTNFPAYVWQIARNRYCAWAKHTHKNSTSMYDYDISEFEISDNTSVENEYIHKEQLSLLHRELAFISSEYREIIVAYYIEDRYIKDIAKSLSLTEGAVKLRLFRARNILKEGMNMAKEFGVKSYNPDDISFVYVAGMTGKVPPTNLMKRKLPKNIVLHTYKNPCTPEELALELGIALPYMEEEISLLKKAELLKEANGKYQTNFCIIGEEEQRCLYEQLYNSISKITQSIINYIDKRIKYFEQNNLQWHYNFCKYEDTKPVLLLDTTDKLWEETLKLLNMMPSENYPKHSDGSDWIISGHEKTSIKKPDFISLEGCICKQTNDYSDKVNFKRYYFNNINDNYQSTPMIDEQFALILKDIAINKAITHNTDDITVLYNYGYLLDGKINITVLSKVCENTQDSTELAIMKQEALDSIIEYVKFFCKVIKESLPAHLKEDTITLQNNFRGHIIRGAVFEEALRINYISNSKLDQNFMHGAYLVI